MTLKELRKIKGLTQGGLAAALGLSASAIAKVESGRGNVSEGMLSKIKEVYGIDLPESVKFDPIFMLPQRNTTDA